MNARDPAYLWDMHNAATELASIVNGVSLATFRCNVTLLRASERCLEIIGEAARRVSEEARSLNPQIPWRDIIGQRNILAHEYGQIDHELIWLTATRDIPPLIDTLRELLARVE